jgi:hypothetical protein
MSPFASSARQIRAADAVVFVSVPSINCPSIAVPTNFSSVPAWELTVDSAENTMKSEPVSVPCRQGAGLRVAAVVPWFSLRTKNAAVSERESSAVRFE